jgi:hypothetical protein
MSQEPPSSSKNPLESADQWANVGPQEDYASHDTDAGLERSDPPQLVQSKEPPTDTAGLGLQNDLGGWGEHEVAVEAVPEGNRTDISSMQTGFAARDPEDVSRQSIDSLDGETAEVFAGGEGWSMLSVLKTFRGFSLLEKFGLVVLLVILFGFVGSFFLVAVYKLPRKSADNSALDLPIQGKLLKVTSAKTFWREPIVNGPNADTIRRGTKLMPVLELGLEGGPAAVRVLFRDGDGLPVGDSITRAVDQSGVIRIPATAGFDDYGMYSAYRAGQGDLWAIEVYEAGSLNASIDDLHKLFRIQISTDLHQD